MKIKKKDFKLNWLHLIPIHYKRSFALIIAFLFINIIVSSISNNNHEIPNFNKIYAIMSPEVSDKDIRLYDDNIYISMKKIDKKSNTIISKSNDTNRSSSASLNDDKIPIEMPFHSSIPKEQLEKLKENIKNKTPSNPSSNIISINKSLLNSESK
jgi:hypothetical protein